MSRRNSGKKMNVKFYFLELASLLHYSQPIVTVLFLVCCVLLVDDFVTLIAVCNLIYCYRMEDECVGDVSELQDEQKPVTSAKKRVKYGRMEDVTKKLRLRTHEMGPDCQCTRLKCFEVISQEERLQILKQLNYLSSYDEQSASLISRISCHRILRHRSRRTEDEASLHSYTYKYKVRLVREGVLHEIPICYKAFLSIHGISAKRVQTIQKKMTEGNVYNDGRGKHGNRPHALSDEVVNHVCDHIGSFKGRNSHYSLGKSSRIFLPAELNIKKMYNMYLETYPDYHLSYESYRTIFNSKFNIKFGYPRCDTCSFCDEYTANCLKLEDDIKLPENADTVQDIRNKLKELETQHVLHLKKAQTFYRRKKAARYAAQKDIRKEAIVFDFQKNLSIPNITTNDVYYRRQLSFFLFNVHILSSQKSVFYTYTEICGHKGADEVSSLIFHFILNYLDTEVQDLHIFCDSSAGQNKNFTVFRTLHYIVHEVKRLNSVRMTFPIRGHSYLECDRNMGLVNQRSHVELPEEWNDVIANSRTKPTPFEVISCEDQMLFRSWTDFLGEEYVKKSPFKSRPIKELLITREHPRLLYYRDTYNGSWEHSVATLPRGKRLTLPPGEFRLPKLKYSAPVPLSEAKYLDLQHLKRFCRPEHYVFYDGLPFTPASTPRRRNAGISQTTTEGQQNLATRGGRKNQ